MADFAICYAFVLPDEDYTPPRYEVVADPTKMDPDAQAISGINSAAFPAQFAAIAVLAPSDRPAAVQSFYQATYWNQWIAQLMNPIAMRVMDSEVNEGQGVGVRLLQRAVNSQRISGAPLVEDGVWGPLTVAGANATNQAALVIAFQAVRSARYQMLVDENPALAPNLPAWLARAQK